MEWEQIRAHFARLLEARQAEGKRQEDVALEGGLDRQNQISRILHNKGRYGPTVEIFIKGVIGLGLQPSEFFTQLEQQEASGSIDLVINNRAGNQVIQLKRSASDVLLDPARFAAAQAAFWQVLAGGKGPARKRKRSR
jgi:transcriptional regulator with XRE-family HTH domain